MTPRLGRPSEVVVVGGSAAGLLTAALIAEAGVRVRVFDAADPLNPAPRTLIVTSRLHDLLGGVPDGAVVNRITRMDMFSPRGAASVPLGKPDLVVERAQISRLLAEKAMQAGAEILKGYRLVGVEHGAAGAVLTLHDTKRDHTECVSTSVLVGADGAGSRIARALGPASRETVPLVQAIVALPPGLPRDVTSVWFDPATTPYFYWLIPKSDGRAAVGLIGSDGRRLHSDLQAFLERHGFRALEVQAARVPLFNRRNRHGGRLGGCTVYLVGDAAGHVKVTTVGGLVSGLWGAHAAAAAILRGTPYARELRGLRRELALHRIVRAAFNRFRAEDYDRLLRLMNPSTIAVLQRYSRDELVQAFTRLVVSQPGFLGLGARLLFR